jgi:hypothetical protein
MINELKQKFTSLFDHIPALKLDAKLYAKRIDPDGTEQDYGMVCDRVITTAFTEYVVQTMIDSATNPLDGFSSHQSGTGTTAESPADTALEVPVGTPVTGTQETGATPNVYKTVANITYDGDYAITEHALTDGTTLMDRSVFTAITVNDGSIIQFTYELTVGG